ncbi:hypothetical protein D3C78_1428070 [compost metagenome]
MANAAGALSQRISKNSLACTKTSRSPPTMFSAKVINGARNSTIANPATSANNNGCIKARANR